MKVIVVLICAFLAQTLSLSINCDFNSAERSFCGWKREWFGTRRAGWRRGAALRRFQLEDSTTESGKFVYFLSRSRPIGFRSRLRSVATSPLAESCFNFSVGLGGSRLPFPDGNSVLKLYMVNEGETVENRNPIWIRNNGPRKVTEFEAVSLRLSEVLEFIPNTRVQFVFEAIRGTAKKAVVAIDDISLLPCVRKEDPVKYEDPLLNADTETKLKMEDVERQLMNLMLPARRGQVEIVEFPNLDVSSQSSNNAPLRNPALRGSGPNELDVRKPRKTRRFKSGKRRRRKGRRGRKGRKRRRKFRKHRRPRPHRRNKKRFRGPPLLGPAFNLVEPARYTTDRSSSLAVMCDFIEYTRRLRGCLRSFFSELQRHPKRCENQYELLESCMKQSALSCVPSREMNKTKIDEIVVGTLRESFKMKKVFCEEDGAFVFPQFPMDKLPIHCGSRYFMKLSECSGSFSSMFHIQHGDPQLCRTYYKANQCQRQATAEECNFDLETMLLYGLNLQYQIAYNPFCLNLPFSSWWPDS